MRLDQFAVGAVGYYDVPATITPLGYRRHIKHMSAEVQSGTFTVNGLLIYSFAPIRLKATASVSTFILYPIDIPNGIDLDWGWKVKVYVDTWAVAGLLAVTTVYEDELVEE